jgi:outer membrane receptor for monomeric catechols
MLRTIAVMAFCLCDAALAVAPAQPRQTPAARSVPAVSYVDRANPYKANRLSSPRASEPILNIPGQTTVLTREMLDDMNATSVRGALGSFAGVTISR